MEDGDRSVIEIRHLLSKLHPRGAGGHKDRVRVITRFRNYVSGTSSGKKKGQRVSRSVRVQGWKIETVIYLLCIFTLDVLHFNF